MKIRNNPSSLFPGLLHLNGLLLLFSILLFSPGCKKTTEEFNTSDERLERPRLHYPPPPIYFYFDNCSNPAVNGNFVAGVPATATITLHYINSPGGAYPAFSSSTVNGIKLTAPAGTLTNSSGNIVLTATGTPINPGYTIIPVSIKNSITCNLSITVLNPPPAPGNCTDPAGAIGSKGCVTFTYRGQQVTYTTIRAADGKIWIQQNLGSPQVALSGQDAASFGHYFQWGRWDDGHQVPGSGSITGSASLQNPSHISSGNPNFIKGTSTATAWWGTGGSASNTWSGTSASSTNGKDPCTALGAGWHLPSPAEWTNALNLEFVSDATSAFESRLKLTESGYRRTTDAMLIPNFVGGYYWTNAAGNGNMSSHIFFDAAYNLFVAPMERGYGINCRCMK